ncbi:MAG TPA: GTP-binding protein [Oscillatoriaceae cyanobacterium]
MTTPGPEFTVLTGFLGSGKTTLLREFLSHPQGVDTAVIVNEAGEIGLDGPLLREVNRDAPISMLANGCICCQAGNDLMDTIDELLRFERPGASAPLKRIVFETSGLSRPAPLLRRLAGLAPWRMPVSIVATYDALRAAANTGFEEAVAQWAAAQRIVVTKLDVAPDDQRAQAKSAAAAINPLAEVVAVTDPGARVLAAFGPLKRGVFVPDPPRLGLGPAHPRISRHLARPSRVVAFDEIAGWLDDLAGALGDRLLRLKGLVRVPDHDAPVLVESVGALFSAPRLFKGGADIPAPFIVLIARDIGPAELHELSGGGLFDFSCA